jgi:hypothetical protein
LPIDQHRLASGSYIEMWEHDHLATRKRVAAAAVLQSRHVECCMGHRTLRKSDQDGCGERSDVEKWRNDTSAVIRTMIASRPVRFICHRDRDRYPLVETDKHLRGRQRRGVSAARRLCFWCLQNNRSQRGFSSRSAELRCPSLCRVEVKMLQRARLRCIGFKHQDMSGP